MVEKEGAEPVKMEDILNKKTTNEESEVISTEAKEKSKKQKNKPNSETVPKGRPKSGRIWKNERKKFSTIVKTKGIRNSFERKQALRDELKRVKEASRALIAAKEEEQQKLKERRRLNIQRQEENRKKSEVVQVIKNTTKIKKMRRKQLRYIEKRDTN